MCEASFSLSKMEVSDDALCLNDHILCLSDYLQDGSSGKSTDHKG